MPTFEAPDIFEYQGKYFAGAVHISAIYFLDDWKMAFVYYYN